MNETNPTPLRLSLCAIVRDEAESLPRCLRSVSSICDEMVIVDTGSRDATIEIARELGAVVIESRWTDCFATARNRALEAARGEWILQLDADESLSPESAAAISGLLVADAPDAWSVAVRSALPSGGHALHHFPRLFRRNATTGYTGRIHERPRLNGTIATAPFVIEHYGYAIDPAAMAEKQKRNLALLERWVADAPDDPEARFHQLTALLAARRFDEAAAVARIAIATLAAGGPEEDVRQAACWNLAGVAELGAGRARAAHDAQRRAIELEPDLVDAYFDRALAGESLGDLDGAIADYAAYFAAVNRWRATGRTDLMLRTLGSAAVAHHNLGVLHEKRGFRARAITAHRRALAANPRFLRSQRSLARLTAR